MHSIKLMLHRWIDANSRNAKTITVLITDVRLKGDMGGITLAIRPPASGPGSSCWRCRKKHQAG